MANSSAKRCKKHTEFLPISRGETVSGFTQAEAQMADERGVQV
ncbi:hypothetical protein [Leptolyngbya sp. NM2-A1]